MRCDGHVMSVTTSVPPQPVFVLFLFYAGRQQEHGKISESKKIKIRTEEEGERQREGRGVWGAGGARVIVAEC